MAISPIFINSSKFLNQGMPPNVIINQLNTINCDEI